MTDERTIVVASEFSATPFGRYVTDGSESGEVFREVLLLPALQGHNRVTLDVDGVASLPSSFWEEALGGLIRAGWTAKDVREKLTIVTRDPELQVYVRLGWRYVDEAEKKAQATTH